MTLLIDFIIILVVILVVLLLLYLRNKKKLMIVEGEFLELDYKYKGMMIKHGNQFESFVPFMNEYPGEKENTVFLGKPVDFISFDEDYVKFIEVKTGKSGLNEKQKRIKELIEGRRVKWYELRFEK